MPTKTSDKCRQCSKLSVENAIARHGEQGDNCCVEIDLNRDPKPFRSIKDKIFA